MLRRLGNFFLDIVEVFVFAIAIFLFVYLLIMQPHKIKGDSMQPNYPNGEYLLTDKLSYRFNPPERGDVIVFEAPGTDGDEYIKRIIGLPGESFKIKGGKIYINGRMLDEDYLDDSIPTNPGTIISEDVSITIPQDKYIVLGDNRLASSDSRMWGFVSTEEIRGKAFFIYWPLDKFGTIEKTSYVVQ